MVTPLKSERINRGLSAAKLATAVGVQAPSISRLENGKMKASPDLANRIAKYFDNAITRDQILFPEDYVDVTAPKRTETTSLRKAS
jgi:transcriptional regulator with XRE-family HTH domain